MTPAFPSLILAYAVLSAVLHVVAPAPWRGPVSFVVVVLGALLVVWLFGPDAALLAAVIAVEGACFGAHTGPIRRLAGADPDDLEG